MKPKKPTMTKIKKINKAIRKGASEKEIRDNFFYRSITKRDLFFENYKEYLVLDNSEDAATNNNNKIKVENTKSTKNTSTQKVTKVAKDTKEIKELLDLLPTLVEMTNIYNSKKSVDDFSEVEELTIPDERKRLSDVKYRSYGVSDSVKAKLEVLYEKYPQYSKVALFNFLLEDSIDKFLK